MVTASGTWRLTGLRTPGHVAAGLLHDSFAESTEDKALGWPPGFPLLKFGPQLSMLRPPQWHPVVPSTKAKVLSSQLQISLQWSALTLMVLSLSPLHVLGSLVFLLSLIHDTHTCHCFYLCQTFTSQSESLFLCFYQLEGYAPSFSWHPSRGHIPSCVLSPIFNILC